MAHNCFAGANWVLTPGSAPRVLTLGKLGQAKREAMSEFRPGDSLGMKTSKTEGVGSIAG